MLMSSQDNICCYCGSDSNIEDFLKWDAHCSKDCYDKDSSYHDFRREWKKKCDLAEKKMFKPDFDEADRAYAKYKDKQVMK